MHLFLLVKCMAMHKHLTYLLLNYSARHSLEEIYSLTIIIKSQIIKKYFKLRLKESLVLTTLRTSSNLRVQKKLKELVGLLTTE